MQKCIYCDFLSAPADDKTKSSYVKALINEIALSEAGLDKNVTSIFIGGGTPSAINAEYIKDILEAVKQRYRVDGNAEITIECNPGTINSEKAYIYREAGINRISFGLQSTDDKELRMLGRIHTFEQFKNSLAIARNAGFTNINIDLMSALPGQTIESFTRVLKEAVSLNTEHISVYSLIIEEGTRLYDNIDNYPDIPDDDDDRKMYALTKEILGQAGYERYEISNYAKAGYECKHNLSIPFMIISVLELVQLHYVIIKGILTSAILIIILRHYVWNMLIIKKAIKSVLWKILRISKRLLRIL